MQEVNVMALPPKTEWRIKMGLSALIDFTDLTLGVAPIAGHVKEVVTIPLAMLLWGWRGSLYSVELLDFTNMLDGFIPTASMIGWTRKIEYEQRHREWEARQAASA